MYYQNGRFSFFLKRGLFWLRVRDRSLENHGLFFRLGQEG